MAKRRKEENFAPRILNRKARYDYHIHESMECGLRLRGTEVKAIRQGQVSLAEAFARVEPETGELWLYNMDVGSYSHAPADTQHGAKDKRKLLARRKQIKELASKTTEKGYTLVPLTLYFNDRGFAKVELGIASGKGQADKRATIKKKEHDRDIRRALGRRR
ncbi:MAG: SsrA-binding protein SmpB [Phycisphaeraceae bacterium]